MSKLFKRALATLLVLLCVITGLPTFEVAAAAELKPDWVYSGIYAVKTSTVAAAEDEHIMLKVNDKWAYCIQPGHHYNTGTEIVKGDSDTWKALIPKAKEAIYLSLLYGAEGNFDAMKAKISGLTYNQAYVATQVLVWEFVLGERTPIAPYKLASGKAGYISTFCDKKANPNVKAAYDFIVSAMSDFYETPSFTAELQGDADTHYLQAIKRQGTWSFVGDDIVLTDDNKVLASYDLSESSINVGNGTLKSTQSGNTLTISGVSVNENGTAKLGTLKAQRKVSTLPKGGAGRLVAYGSNSSAGEDDQDIVTMIFEDDSAAFNPSADPPFVYLNVGLTLSKAERDFYIQKTCKAVDASGYTTNINDAESLSGWYFKVKLPSVAGGFYVYLGPTDSTGKTQTISEAIQSSGYANTFEAHNVPVGNYVITETGKKDSSGKSYFPNGWSSTFKDNKTTITLTENSGMNEVVRFTNNYSIPVQIKKTFEDGDGGSNPYYFLLTNSSATVRYLLKTTDNGYLNVVKSLTGNAYRNDGNDMYLEMGSYTLTEWGQLKSGISEGNSSQSNYTIPARYTAITELPIIVSASELKDSKLAGYDSIFAEAVNIVSYPIAVIKSDKDDSTKRLSGAVFGIYSDPDCKNELTRVTTNSYGEGVTDRLRNDGYYYVREITPPVGYTLDSSIHKVYVHHTQPKVTLSDGSEAIPVYADNDLTPSFAAIKKVDDENKVVPNVYFAFYRKSDNKCLETGLKTNSSGVAITKNTYDPGLYYFKETAVPKGYSIDKNKKYEVEIKKSDVASEIIVLQTYYAPNAVNAKIKSNAAIFKYDQSNKPLAGAVFSFYKDGSSTALETGLTSDSNGLVKTANKYNPGKYYFVETKAPTGYQLDSTKKYVTIEMTDTSKTYYAEAIVNHVNQSKLAVHKIDYYYGYSLKNAKFGIYTDSACKTEARDTITTDNTGYGESTKSFDPGTYYLKETVAPEGYSLSSTIHKVVIPKTDITSDVKVTEIPNTPLPQNIQVKKVDENNGVSLQGAQFQVRKPAENLLDQIILTDEFSPSNSGNGWRTAAWGTGTNKTITYTASIADNVGVDGSGAIKINVTQVTGDARGRVYLNVRPDSYSDSLKAGEKYTFSCRVRTENIVRANDVSEYGAQITPIFVDTSGNVSVSSVTESDAIDYNTKTSINNGFVYISVDFTIPEKVTLSNGTQTDFSYLRLTLALRGATGTAYFDDIRLTSNEFCVWEGATLSSSTARYYYSDTEGFPDSYEMYVSKASSTGVTGQMIQRINIDDIKPNGSYTFSCYVKVDSDYGLTPYNASEDYGVRLQVMCAKSGAGYPVGGSSFSDYISSVTSSSVNDGYIYLSVDYIAPSETDLATCSHLQVRVELYNATGDVYVTQPRLYLNNKQDYFDSYKKANWGKDGTITYTTGVSTDTFAFGGKSLKMDVTSINIAGSTSTEVRARAYRDVYDLTPGTTYTLSAYIKTENLAKTANATTYGAVIAGTVYDIDGNTSSYYSSYVTTANTSVSKNSGFVRVSRDITLPSDFNYLRLNLALRGATGTAYFDEVRLEPKNTVLSTITTNNSGIATYSPDLYSGEYEFMEISAPNGYYFSNATSFIEISPKNYNSSVITNVFPNTPTTRSLSLIKYDGYVLDNANTYPNKPVAGAVYVLCHAQTTSTKFATATTIEDGPAPFININTGNIQEFTVGNYYYLYEIEAPYGYMKDSNVYKITITADGYSIINTSTGNDPKFFSWTNNPDTIVVNDDPLRGQVNVTKKFFGENVSKYAQIVIYNEKGEPCHFNYSQRYLGVHHMNYIQRVSINDNETRSFYGLPVGKYYIEEINAAEGYYPHQEKIWFEIKPNASGSSCDPVNITINNYKPILWDTGGTGTDLINPLGIIIVAIVPVAYFAYSFVSKNRKKNIK